MVGTIWRFSYEDLETEEDVFLGLGIHNFVAIG